MASRTASLPPFLPTCRSAMTITATTVEPAGVKAGAASGPDYVTACRKLPAERLASESLADVRTEAQAVLPYGILHAAALFASPDPGKPVLGAVHVRPYGDGVTVEATNRHIACRFWVPGMPSGPDGGVLWLTSGSLKLPADLLRKRTAYGQWLAVYGERLDIRGGRFGKAAQHPPTEFLASLPRWGASGDLAAYDYPNMDQLWPSAESLPCNPGAPVGMAAAYLETIAKAARLVGDDGNCALKLRTLTPRTPMTFELHGGPCGVWGAGATATAEFLLMPVQVRD